MDMTRRAFLQYGAGALAVTWPKIPHLYAAQRSVHAVLLDLPHADFWRESAAGYAAALADCGCEVARVDVSSLSHCALVIVPAVLQIPQPARREIARLFESGAIVVVESGGGFAPEADFQAHRAALREAWGVHVSAPVDLWTAQSCDGIPYVDYVWPGAARVRDFSRAVPLMPQEGEFIAWIDDLPVGLKREVGRGTLIVLGSALGPALWAGDAQARQWLLRLPTTLPLLQ